MLVITLKMTKLDICVQKSLLSPTDCEIVAVLSARLTLNSFKKMTVDIGCDILK